MARFVILDTSPLSNSVLLPSASDISASSSDHCRDWLNKCESAGTSILVPAVAYYEVLRELERRGATSKINRLRQFCFGIPSRFIPLRTAHLDKAAQLWAMARNSGTPGASPDALDGDVLIAAQALSLGLAKEDFIVATSNQAHFRYFVPCDYWYNIKP